MQKESLTEIAAKYIEIINQIKKFEEEKEELRKKLVSSEKKEIKTENGTVRIFTKKNAILDDGKIISTLSKEDLAEVVSISMSKFRKFAENKLNIDDFIVDYKEVKEVKIILPLKTTENDIK